MEALAVDRELSEDVETDFPTGFAFDAISQIAIKLKEQSNDDCESITFECPQRTSRLEAIHFLGMHRFCFFTDFLKISEHRCDTNDWVFCFLQITRTQIKM